MDHPCICNEQLLHPNLILDHQKAKSPDQSERKTKY